MSEIKTRKYVCMGCGKDRPCFVETNQEDSEFRYFEIEELKCILDSTNQTSYNWEQKQDEMMKTETPLTLKYFENAEGWYKELDDDLMVFIKKFNGFYIEVDFVNGEIDEIQMLLGENYYNIGKPKTVEQLEEKIYYITKGFE